jgi:hypothetical protein
LSAKAGAAGAQVEWRKVDVFVAMFSIREQDARTFRLPLSWSANNSGYLRPPRPALHLSESSLSCLRRHCPIRSSPGHSFSISALQAARTASRPSSPLHAGKLAKMSIAKESMLACFIQSSLPLRGQCRNLVYACSEVATCRFKVRYPGLDSNVAALRPRSTLA